MAPQYACREEKRNKLEYSLRNRRQRGGDLKNEVEHILTRKVSNHESLQKVEQAKKEIFIREINELETCSVWGLPQALLYLCICSSMWLYIPCTAVLSVATTKQLNIISYQFEVFLDSGAQSLPSWTCCFRSCRKNMREQRRTPMERGRNLGLSGLPVVGSLP